jgi:hypothetical protein
VNNRYYVETLYLGRQGKRRFAGYRVYDGRPPAGRGGIARDRLLTGEFKLKDHQGDAAVALLLANKLRDDLNGGIA